MNTTSVVLLEFNPERDDLGKDKELRDGLSVAVQIGDTLWVTNDETISLERLSLVEGGEHRQLQIWPTSQAVLAQRLPSASSAAAA